MNFTRNWDESQPPDTQPANQLGLIIRQMKLDVRERIVALSGTIAERPDLDDEFGNANNGALYFATDVGGIFRWNGAEWLDVTNAILSTFIPSPKYVDGTVNTVGANAALGNSIIIPGGTLKVGDVIHIYAAGKVATYASGTPSYRLLFGATVLVGPVGIEMAGVGSSTILHAHGHVLPAGSQKFQIGGWVPVNANGVALIVAAAENIANPITVKTDTLTAAGVWTVTFESLIVTVN